MRKQLLTKMLLIAASLFMGTSAWATAVPYTVGTEGTGDAWENRKYSDAYEIAPGETYHFTFTNTSYGSNNWNNWLLDCKATADTSVDDWYFTMRSDNYGWGTSYNATMRYADFVWADFQTVMNGATVDMYVDYNSTDKIIRTYATISKSETTWHYNFASKAIDAESVFLFLSEELAVLNITTAEKVANIPTETYGVYKRSITSGYGYTWSITDPITNSVDYTGWTNSGGTKTLDLTDGLMYTLGNAGGYVRTTVSPTIGNIVNVDVNFFLKGATGANNTGQNYSYFRYGNIYITNEAQGCQSYYTLNGAPTVGNPGTNFHGTSAGSSSIYRKTGIDYRLVMEINTLTNMLVSMKVYVNGAEDPSVNISDQALSSYDYTTLEIGYNKGRSSTNSIHKLKNISITETPQTITTVDFTVKFQDTLGNTLKDDVVHDNGVVGEVYQATAEDMETFYNNVDESLATKKYIYNSGQNTSVVASSTASENVITLLFDVYDKTAYTVNAQAGGSDIKTGIATGTAYLDGSATEYWSKYIKVSDQWYVADESTYGAAITSATTNVAYTTTDAIDYFFEFEDMSDNGAILNALSGTAISGGASKRFNANGKKWTTALTGGTYTLDMYCNGNNGKSVTMPMYYCDTDGSNPVYIGESTACQASTWAVKRTANVVIPDGKALCFYNNSSYTHNYIVDYLTLKRTGAAVVSATLGTNGYATFASEYPLDLTTANLPECVKAYKASVSGKTVTFTALDQTVPANTGVLLEGTPSASVNIPVVASGSAVADNAFEVNTTGATFSGDDDYYYFGLVKNTLTFGVFDPSTTAIPASKAYLKVLKTSVDAARELNVVFEDEATGISAIPMNSEVMNNNYFDLQGRRVAQPTKGMYIVNGKKIIIK